MEHCIDRRTIALFTEKLTELERSSLTVEKYIRDVKSFRRWLGSNGHFDKSRVIRFKQMLREKYRLSSANSMLSALNKFFQLMGGRTAGSGLSKRSVLPSEMRSGNSL